MASMLPAFIFKFKSYFSGIVRVTELGFITIKKEHGMHGIALKSVESKQSFCKNCISKYKKRHIYCDIA